MSEETSVVKWDPRKEGELILQQISIDDIRQRYAPGTTEKEFALLIDQIQANGLDPRKREVYCVKYGQSPANIITGYQVYIQRAERTGLLDGWECNVQFDGNTPVAATCTVYRKDWQRPFVWSVPMSEANRNQATWKQMPVFMLKKVCIAQAFRLAFPNELGTLPYTSDELSTFADDDTSRRALDITETRAPAQTTQKPPATEKKTPSRKEQLQQQCEDAGLSTSGTIAELEARLDENTQDEPSSAETPAEAAPQNGSPLLPDEDKQKIIGAFKKRNIEAKLIGSVLGAEYDNWNEEHRDYLRELLKEMKADPAKANAKWFASNNFDSGSDEI